MLDRGKDLDGKYVLLGTTCSKTVCDITFIYLEQVAWQNLQPLLWIFHVFKFGILVQHTLKDIQEKLQRELVQEVDLDGWKNNSFLLEWRNETVNFKG